MSEIQRYNADFFSGQMLPDKYGAWVPYDHIASLQQQLAEARRNALEEAAGICREWIDKSPTCEAAVACALCEELIKAAAIREAKK